MCLLPPKAAKALHLVQKYYNYYTFSNELADISGGIFKNIFWSKFSSVSQFQALSEKKNYLEEKEGVPHFIHIHHPFDNLISFVNICGRKLCVLERGKKIKSKGAIQERPQQFSNNNNIIIKFSNHTEYRNTRSANVMLWR